MTFQKFDASGYKSNWQEGYLYKLFKNRERVWNPRNPIDLERLEGIACGVTNWLNTLPEEAEVGTTDLVRQLIPEAIENVDDDFFKFVIRRIERCRYAGLLTGYYYAIPNPRSKTIRHFYKYHKRRLDPKSLEIRNVPMVDGLEETQVGSIPVVQSQKPQVLTTIIKGYYSHAKSAMVIVSERTWLSND